MSAYINGWCVNHGDYDLDVDSPQDECPICTEAGEAPSQRLRRVVMDLIGNASVAARLLEDDCSIGRGTPTRAEVAADVRNSCAAAAKLFVGEER